MGIVNINYLIQPDETNRQALQAQAALEEKLMLDHRKGKHPYGSMRRECPLCQADR